MLHSGFVVALIVVVVNDHFLKAACPGFLTGKLSDFAGLVFAPLFLQAAWEMAMAADGKDHRPSLTVLSSMVVVCAVLFAAIKTNDQIGDFYRLAMGVARWPFRAAATWINGEKTPSVLLVKLARDPTDLMALPMVLVALWIGSRRCIAKNIGHKKAW